MNYYELLGCSPSATYAEIKKNYQMLAKQTHPDRQSANTQTSKFIQIDEAWKVLRDATLRKTYDSFLLQQHCQDKAVIYAEIHANSLQFESGKALYPCRCGGFFVIDEEEFSEQNIKVQFECSECSNHILITV